jgi:sigma-B regulation protein RsbU (phosphoserine phosphatase)
MTPERPRRLPFPESVRETLDDLSRHLALELRLVQLDGDGDDGPAILYPEGDTSEPRGEPLRRAMHPWDGRPLELEIRGLDGGQPGPSGELVAATVARTLEFAREIRFFTLELSERYEEINLLYSISEILGSILRLDDAARNILNEVCDVMGARRGALWVHEAERFELRVVASVGDKGFAGPVAVDDGDSLTARVFRQGRAVIAGSEALKLGVAVGGAPAAADSVLSVPIRYTPPEGSARTVGVINLIGRRHGGGFTASDQKLLSAIASQVGSALENNRLIQQSLVRERMAREMELAHNLQLKLLPAVERFEGARVAARVEAADLVGGDFYQVFSLTEDRVGVMIGDVSGHGFPAALIMALSMSAATIYASEFAMPAKVLRHLDDALRDELETTEMYLSLFYGVLDPAAGTLTYGNAGHPHAFLVAGDGGAQRLAATDPPVGIAGPSSYTQQEVAWDPTSDLLLLFTDGLSDTLTSGTVRDGERFVVETVVRHREMAPRAIVDALFSLAGDGARRVPPDDRTALVLRGR